MEKKLLNSMLKNYLNNGGFWKFCFKSLSRLALAAIDKTKLEPTLLTPRKGYH